MEKKEVFKCSYYKCGKTFSRQNYSFDTKHRGINDEEKVELIIECILITRLFCMKCSINHAVSICRNSKISIEE